MAGVRADLWLWAARFFKTRVLAKQAIMTGKVALDGQRIKPARPLRPGDRLQVQRGEERFDIQILALSTVRGPANVAQRLYEEDPAARQRREAERFRRAAERAGYRPPDGKPDKRARRLIRALGDLDAM